MKWFGLLLAVGSFCLVDCVVLLACCNMAKWTTVDPSLLWQLLLAGVAGTIIGLLILRFTHPSDKA